MAGASLLALLDDITALLDDVATLSKTAISKTGGVVGDDLAVNAEQLTGFRAERELPVVWAVAKGSLVNKALLVPAALLISAYLPWLITPLLMVGGAFLCYEGAEKVWHALRPSEEDAAHRAALSDALRTATTDLVALERTRISGAIRTDFILSAEIIVIALGTMATAPLQQQIVALSGIAVAITVFVYGLVAGIVKLDDIGLELSRRGASSAAIGRGIVRTAPWLMRGLSVGGTGAMFLVGGDIITHGVPILAHAVHAIEGMASIGIALALLFDALVGVAVGGAIVATQGALRRLRPTAA